MASAVDRDSERRVFVHLVPCSRTTADFAGKRLASLRELCEEEEILAMAFGEGVPDLPGISGLAPIEMAISNGNIEGGEDIRVSDFWVKIEADQFLIIRAEPKTLWYFKCLWFLVL